MTECPYKNADSFIKNHEGLWCMLGATYKKINSKLVYITSQNKKYYYWTSNTPNQITERRMEGNI